MRLAMIFAVGLTCASPALATKLVHFFDCGEDTQVRHYSYDQSSVRKQADSLLVPIYGDYTQASGSRSANAQLLWSVDCARGTFVEKRRIEYDSRGRIIARYGATTTMQIGSTNISQKLSERVCS